MGSNFRSAIILRYPLRVKVFGRVREVSGIKRQYESRIEPAQISPIGLSGGQFADHAFVDSHRVRATFSLYFAMFKLFVALSCISFQLSGLSGFLLRRIRMLVSASPA